MEQTGSIVVFEATVGGFPLFLRMRVPVTSAILSLKRKCLQAAVNENFQGKYSLATIYDRALRNVGQTLFMCIILMYSDANYRRSPVAIKSKKSTRITVSLADEEHAGLATLAEKYDVSLSWLTRKAVLDFLQQYGKGRVQLSLDLPSESREGEQ